MPSLSELRIHGTESVTASVEVFDFIRDDSFGTLCLRFVGKGDPYDMAVFFHGASGIARAHALAAAINGAGQDTGQSETIPVLGTAA